MPRLCRQTQSLGRQYECCPGHDGRTGVMRGSRGTTALGARACIESSVGGFHGPGSNPWHVQRGTIDFDRYYHWAVTKLLSVLRPYRHGEARRNSVIFMDNVSLAPPISPHPHYPLSLTLPRFYPNISPHFHSPVPIPTYRRTPCPHAFALPPSPTTRLR